MYSHLLVERKSFLVFSKKKKGMGKKTKQLRVKQQTFVGCQR